MACDIQFSVSTAGGASFTKQVDYVNLPTAFGSLGILRCHGDPALLLPGGEADHPGSNGAEHIAVAAQEAQRAKGGGQIQSCCAAITLFRSR